MTRVLRGLLTGLVILLPMTTHAADGDLVWARGMGGTGDDRGNDIAVDSAGNVYTTGRFRGTVDFDPGSGTFNLTSAGGNDVFVQKLDASGDLVWARSMGGTSDDEGDDIAVDSAGFVYTTGYFSGTADFDPGEESFNLTSAGGNDIFVQKLDASGDLVWARRMGGTGSDSSNGIALGSAGHIYIAGDFRGTVDFDPGAGAFNLTSAGGPDIFVQKLDSSGTLIWVRSMGGASTDRCLGMAVDGAGNVYTTGTFVGTVDFDPGEGTVSLTDDLNGFVQKLDSSGALVWVGKVGAFGNYGYANSIAVDNAGNVHTTGQRETNCYWDNIFDSYICDIETIIQKYASANGYPLWSRNPAAQVSGGAYITGLAIVSDQSGNVYNMGYFQGTLDFGTHAGTVNLTSAGDDDIYVQKLDASGTRVWSRRIGGTNLERGYGIAVDNAGNLYTTGRFQGTADFDPGMGTVNLASAGSDDIFVVKLSGPDSIPPNATAIVPITTGPTNADSIDFTVTFDENIRNFDGESDLLINHLGTASTGASFLGGGSVYTVTVTGITGDASFTLAVRTDSDVEDEFGNALASSVGSEAVAIDNTPPSVSIGAPTGSPLNSAGMATYPVAVDGADSINLTSDAVTLNHSGTAGGSVVVVDGTSATPVIEVSGVTGDGSYTISINPGIATDAAGNSSEATSPSEAVTVDNTAPAFSDVVVSPSEATEGDTVSISFDSSEPIAGDPTVALNGNAATRTSKAAFAYQYTLSSTDPVGPASIEIVGTDTVGNTGTLSNTTALTILEVAVEGEGDGSIDGEGGAAADGEGEGVVEGTVEGEGDVEGVVEGSSEGAIEGDVEGLAEGEGAPEGEGEGEDENPPAGCSGCNVNGAPMEKALGDWLAGFLGLAVLLGAYLRLQRQLHPGA